MDALTTLIAHSPAADDGLDPAPFGLMAFAALYIAGAVRATRHAPRAPRRSTWLAFIGALAALIAALVAPLEPLADTGVAWHMVQHLVLVAVAAPLLVVSQPFTTMLWILPEDARHHARRVWQTLIATTAGRRWYVWAVASLIVYTATMWVWHLPFPYDEAVSNAWVHGLEHVMFTWSAFVFLWVLLGLHRRREYGAGVLVVFAFSLGSIALGALLTFMGRPLYQLGDHHHVTTAMEQQQVAGVLMWAYGGLTTLALAMTLFVNWLRWHERADDRFLTTP